MQKPVCCAIEGLDGAGKFEQANRLSEALRKTGQLVLQVAEPCKDLPQGRLLRQLLASGEYPESHIALFLADRIALLASKVKPALASGISCVSERSFLSSLVYQQEHWPVDWLIDIHRMLPVRPDVLVWLDVPAETGLHRVHKRALAIETYERLDIQERNRQRYYDFVAPDGKYRSVLQELLAPGALILMVNGVGDPQAIHEDIWRQVQPHLERQ